MSISLNYYKFMKEIRQFIWFLNSKKEVTYRDFCKKMKIFLQKKLHFRL